MQRLVRNNTLRVGLIVDNKDLHFIAWDLIERSLNNKNYQISALIVQEINLVSNTKKSILKIKDYISNKGFKKFIERISFEIIHKTEYFISRFIDPICVVSQKYKDIKNFDIPKIYVKPILSSSGLVYRYKKEDLNKIIDHDIDVLIRCGSGILRGEILNICKFGVISFHHGDNQEFRGSPAGFWETYFQVEKTGFIIQRLNNELDGGDVLFKGSIRTKLLYLINQNNIFYKSSPFMDKFLQNLSLTRKITNINEKLPYSSILFSIPSLEIQVNYLLKTFFILTTKIIKKILKIGHIWYVGYQKVGDWRESILWKSNIIKNIKGHYFADPFILKKNQSHFIFVEDFNIKEAKGSISVIKIENNKSIFLGKALEEEFHLSFPFIIEVDDEVYMIPESSQSNQIRIYKCINFPLKWELHKILMKKIKAVDTLIFKVKDKWWMLTNIDSAKMREHESELHIFYADKFDSSNWVEHPKNPVIFSPEKGRNGGLIKDINGDLYRIFQRQSPNKYGNKMGISKIKKITKTDYQEEEIAMIEPKFFKGINGTHTLNFKDELLVIDFSKIENY